MRYEISHIWLVLFPYLIWCICCFQYNPKVIHDRTGFKSGTDIDLIRSECLYLGLHVFSRSHAFPALAKCKPHTNFKASQLVSSKCVSKSQKYTAMDHLVMTTDRNGHSLLHIMKHGYIKESAIEVWCPDPTQLPPSLCKEKGSGVTSPNLWAYEVLKPCNC